MTTTPPDDYDAVRQIVEALKQFDPSDQERIIRWAREKLGLKSVDSAAIAPAPPSSAGPGEHSQHGIPRTKDIKTFVQSKNPQSDNQFAAVVAYYYLFEAPGNEHRDTITKDDLIDAVRKVDRVRIKRPAQTLVNAHARGYFDKAETGSYKLSTVGENLVAMALPPGKETTVRAAPRNSKRQRIARRTKARQSRRKVKR